MGIDSCGLVAVELMLLAVFAVAAGCGAPLLVVASVVAMQGRSFGVYMSHNENIAGTSLCI